MTTRSGNATSRSTGLLTLAFLLGCNGSLQPSASKTSATPIVTYSPQMSNKVWDIRKAVCVDCHVHTYNGAYTAGINMLTKSSLTSGQVQTVYDAIAYEKAPAGYLMAQADRDSVRRWAWQNGATAYDLYVPSTLSWSQATQMSGASNGSDGQAAGRFYGFSIEDLHRPDLWIENYTDRDDVTKTCLTLQDFHSVDQDSFSSSTHPVNYIVPDGVAYNGRVKAFTWSGYVTQDRHMGVFFHSRLLKKGASPSNARDKRTYVRLAIDQDYFAFQQKMESSPNGAETWPASGAGNLTAESGYKTYNDSLFLYNDKFYWVEVSAAVVSNKMRYHARLYTTPSGTLLASIGAERSDPNDAYGGFGFWTYTQNGTNKKDRWSGWDNLSATSMFGSGSLPPNGTGCRPPCELE